MEMSMKGADRKAAIAAYKERKPALGVYAVRCAASGELWVGATPNLDTIRNRLWFGLRLGNDPHPDLQAAWRLHGGDAFSFEILERLPDEEGDAGEPFLRQALLKERAAAWRARLGAAPI
jgi:hypothetical protein